jgi:uncharacterized protein (DUF983 family)
LGVSHVIANRLVATALRRGFMKQCPHCGLGPLFRGWAGALDACPVCHLVYERNAGDTWAFTIFGDRIPVAAALAIVYFGIGRLGSAIGMTALAAAAAVLIWSSPNRWGVGIALHYLSRVYWPDPADPLPAPVEATVDVNVDVSNSRASVRTGRGGKDGGTSRREERRASS